MKRRTFLGGLAASALSACTTKNLSLPFNKTSREKIKILFLTDLHFSYKIENQSLIETVCSKAIKKINEEKADLVIGGGDWISQGFSNSYEQANLDFKWFKNFWNEINGKKILVPGNHDFSRTAPKTLPNLDLFYSHFPDAMRDQAVYDLGLVTILGLQTIQFNSKDYDEYDSFVSLESLDWLKQEISSHLSDQPQIILSHVPLMTGLNFWSKEIFENHWTVRNSREVFEIVKNHSVIFLQGHLHVNEVISWNNSHSIIGGAVCGRWWDPNSKMTPRGFACLTLSKSKVDWSYLSINS